MVKRHYCFKRKSLLDDYARQRDEKFVEEHGITVIKRRINENAIIDGFGRIISDEKFDDSDLKIVIKKLTNQKNQKEFGEVNFDGKDTIVCQTSQVYDPRVNDIVVISTEFLLVYDLSDSESEETFWKIKKVYCDSFDYDLPTLLTLTLERRFSSDLYRD